jgi:hypothetical protein
MLARLKFKLDNLVNDILSHIPDDVIINGVILDPAMGGGQFVKEVERRKRIAGKTDSEIKRTVFGIESNILRRNYAVNKHKLVGSYVVGNALTMDFDGMKFDVVIGNPPYGMRTDSGGTLWEKFANKSFNTLVKKGGYVALINPPSFIGKHLRKGIGKSDYTCFKKNQIEQLHILDGVERDKYFRGIGSEICWYVARAITPANLTKLVGYDDGNITTSMIDMNYTSVLPKVVNNTTIDIHTKLLATSKIQFIQNREIHYHSMKKKNQVSDECSIDYQYKTYFSHTLIRFSNYKFSDYTNIKVMIPQTSTIDKVFIDSNCNVSEDLFYITCSTLQQAEDIKAHLNSNLIKYIGNVYRQGRNLGSMLHAKIIPDLHYNINLTNKEIEYINANY